MFEPTREERRDAVEVRRENNDRIVDGCEDVGAAARDFLLAHVVAERGEPRREPLAGLGLAACRRVDVDERSRESEDL